MKAPVPSRPNNVKAHMNYVSLLMLALGIFSVRVRTRRYIINVAVLVLVWQLLALLVGPGVAARKAIDGERARVGSDSAMPAESAVREAMMESGASTALSLFAWPFLLAAAMKLRKP
jgi:hypothetical protein